VSRRLRPPDPLCPGPELLGNALKFTMAGGTVTTRTGQDGPGAVLEVADTDIGIPADELPRVFDRFWRGQARRPYLGQWNRARDRGRAGAGTQRHVHRPQPAGSRDAPHPHRPPRLHIACTAGGFA
jgi:hypothetical protein